MRVVIVIKIDDDLVKGLDCKSSNRLGDFESGIGFGLMAPYGVGEINSGLVRLNRSRDSVGRCGWGVRSQSTYIQYSDQWRMQ